MPVALWGDDGRRALPRLVLRPLPRRLAPGRLDHVHRARQLHHHRPLGRDAEPRRRAARHRRVLCGGRGAPRGRRRARRPPRGPGRRRRRAAAVRGPGGQRVARRRAPREDRDRAAQRAVAAARARHDRLGAGDPAHADRQEARGAGQADPARRVLPSGWRAATRSPSRPHSTRSWRSPPGALRRRRFGQPRFAAALPSAQDRSITRPRGRSRGHSLAQTLATDVASGREFGNRSAGASREAT